MHIYPICTKGSIYLRYIGNHSLPIKDTPLTPTCTDILGGDGKGVGMSKETWGGKRKPEAKQTKPLFQLPIHIYMYLIYPNYGYMPDFAA